MRGERPAAGDLAQDDAAAVERLAELGETVAHRVLARLQGVGQLVERDRLGREEEQRLDLAGEPAHATASPRLVARRVLGRGP